MIITATAAVRRFAAGIAASLTLAAAGVGAATLTTRVTDPDGQPLPEAVVVARPVGAATAGPAGAAEEMVQQGQSFNPAVMVVQAGTRVRFPNKDRMRHHIYSFSEAKRFEIRLYSGEQVPTILFDRPGVVALGCNIHDWMRAFIYVTDSPWFALTDAGGAAVLADLPAGAYELAFWHPSLGETPVVRPGIVELGRAAEIVQILPTTGGAVAQVPVDDDPLAAKFRRRVRQDPVASP